MILRKLDRSWILTWTLGLIVAILAFSIPPIVKAIEPTPAFKIIDVRDEQGQLVVEAQHFYPSGKHWFYQLYSWQGREAYSFPRVANADGHFLLEDGSIAPFYTNDLEESLQYLETSQIYFELLGDYTSRSYEVVSIDDPSGFFNLGVNSYSLSK